MFSGTVYEIKSLRMIHVVTLNFVSVEEISLALHTLVQGQIVTDTGEGMRKRDKRGNEACLHSKF